MSMVRVWNAVVALRRPTLGDAEAAAGNVARDVLPGDRSLKFLGGNVCAELPHILRAANIRSEPLVNVALWPSAPPFASSLQPDVVFAVLTDVEWRGLPLSASAESFREALGSNPRSRLAIATESDMSGRVIRWKINLGPLQLEFLPDGTGEPDAGHSRLSRLLYSYGLAERQDVDASLIDTTAANGA